jgi:hypothetical protein
MAMDGKRDPRADPDPFPPVTPTGFATGLTGVVFDPDQSVAQRLGEHSLDASIGVGAGDNGNERLPDLGHDSALDEERDAPTVTRPRSMRSAMMIIGLVLVSGAAATAFSLGIIGGPPSRLRTPPAATPAAAAPGATPPAATPAPPTATPTSPMVEPEPTAAAQPAAVVEAAPIAEQPAAVVQAAPIVAPQPASADPVGAGDALLRAGDLDGALVQYRAALAADSDDHHAMEGMARVHLARGEPALALPYAEAIVKRRPKRGSYRSLLDEVRRAAR